MSETTQQKPPFTFEALHMLIAKNPEMDWIKFFDFQHVSDADLSAIADDARRVALEWIDKANRIEQMTTKH